MKMNYTRQDYEDAVSLIRSRISIQPTIGLVLGSGLGGLANAIDHAVSIPYEDIPGFPQSTVQGHHGRLVIGELEGKTVLCQQGRTHFYEGYSMAQVTFAIRVMYFLGIETVILTNAAGGINAEFRAGDIMLINDHINLIGMVGNNPLMGWNDDSIGPRFPSMTQTYDRRLRDLTHQVAQHYQIPLQEGVYMGLSGPSFETPAEVRMIRMLGGDAVGMSTVNEVLVARHAGMRVLAFSSITNVGIDQLDTETETNHEEVLEVGRVIVPRLTMLIRGVLQRL
ncbi:MAG: purine-nucleoside phosphorylase [Anaerolineae bacterium]|jgi:purine-nucleoside phosphorylase|nr:purine-nucleoside phosphorylase [Anaerolineae bacterium]